MRTASMMGFVLTMVFFWNGAVASAQPPAAKVAHPSVFVTEVYRLGKSGRQRQLNVFVDGMKRDVWKILNCYQPCYRAARRPAVKLPPVAPKPVD